MEGECLSPPGWQRVGGGGRSAIHTDSCALFNNACVVSVGVRGEETTEKTAPAKGYCVIMMLSYGT